MNPRKKIVLATGGVVAVGAVMLSQGTASAATTANSYSTSSAVVSAETSTSAEVTPMAIGSLAAKAAKAVGKGAKKATVYAKAANNEANRQALGEVARAASLSAFGGTSAVQDDNAGVGAEAFDR